MALNKSQLPQSDRIPLDLMASSFSPFRIILFAAAIASIAVSSKAADEVYVLRKILISDTLEKAAALGDDDGGSQSVVVHDIGFLQTAEFRARVGKFIGQPINNLVLNELASSIVEFTRGHDRLIASVLPVDKQDISKGTLRLAVVVGRYSQLIFRGNRWSSSQFLQGQLGVNPGDEIRRSVLEEGLQWANANPFRQLQVSINQLPNDSSKANLVVAVADARPFKAFVSYSNAGVPLIGRNQYTAGVQLGSLWGLDHQATYQFITTDDIRLLQGHSFDYVAPLPWRHFIQLSANYVKVQPTIFDVINQSGESAGASLRYRIPMGGGDLSEEFFFGGDFKESNNNLEYGGLNVSAVKINIFQAVVGATMMRRDPKGAWIFGASINLSPGNLNSRNTDEAFQPLIRNNAIIHIGRLGARARYATGTFSIQRWQKLSHDWDFSTRFTGQLASSNVPSDEQMTIGGSGSIRGFNTNVFAGEQGYVFTNDLQTPVFKKQLSFLSKKANTLSTRFGVFYDAGAVSYKTHFRTYDISGHPSGWDDDFLHPLASTGVSFRATLGTTFSLSFDYGVPVTHPRPPVDGHGQGHIKAMLAF